MNYTIRQMNHIGQRALAEAGIHDAVFDARALLSFVLDVPFSRLPLHYEDEVTGEQKAAYHDVLKKRAGGIPLQYITNEQEFMGISFYVDERVLIPRLDTEILAEEAVSYIKERSTSRSSDQNPHGKSKAASDQADHEVSSDEQDQSHHGQSETCMEKVRVLDLCCGSGAIGLSIKVLSEGKSQIGDDAVSKRDRADNNRQNCIDLTLSDISRDALCVTSKNAEALGMADDVRIVRGDLFEGIESEDFDLIVSNPPYIRSDVIEKLDTEVRDHEPALALDGGVDGLDIYRRIAHEAPDHLNPGGVLMMEIGAEQAEDVAELIEETGKYIDIQIKKDLAGLDRLVVTKVQ